MDDVTRYERGAVALRWLADLIEGGQPVSFTLNWVHPKGLPAPPLGHGYGGPLADVVGWHVMLQPHDGRLLAEEASDRLERERYSEWMEPLRYQCLGLYTMKECLVAAACCARVPPQRWGELAQLLYMRSGRGETSLAEALAYLGFDQNARTMQ